MKILAGVLIIFNLFKLCVIESQRNKELTEELKYKLQSLESQKKAIIYLVIDGIIGILCGIYILFSL